MDQSKTPYFQALLEYVDSGVIPFHTPGHKQGIGMGETVEDRLDFLSALQELQPDEVPVNFLNPRPGTPMAQHSLVEPTEALRLVAMARLADRKSVV